jgi:hypothetical protein
MTDRRQGRIRHLTAQVILVAPLTVGINDPRVYP